MMLNFPKVVLVQVGDHYDFGVEIAVLLSTSHLPFSLSYLYIDIVIFIYFNYLILKCSNNSPLILILNFLVKERLLGKDRSICIMKV